MLRGSAVFGSFDLKANQNHARSPTIAWSNTGNSKGRKFKGVWNLCQSANSKCCERLQIGAFAADQRQILGTSPAIELAFAGDGEFEKRVDSRAGDRGERRSAVDGRFDFEGIFCLLYFLLTPALPSIFACGENGAMGI